MEDTNSQTDKKPTEQPTSNLFNVGFLESPWLAQQTKSHLVFGVFYSAIPLFWPVLLVAILYFLNAFLSGTLLQGLMQKYSLLLILFFFLKIKREYQAIVGWLAVKSAMGIAALMIATVGAGVSYSRGQTDFWPNLLLGLIWIPGPEFVTRLTPHQKWITLARLVLSAPCVYFGINSGFWN